MTRLFLTTKEQNVWGDMFINDAQRDRMFAPRE